MQQEERDEAKRSVTFHLDTFALADLKSSREQIESLRKNFIPVIIENVERDL